MNHVYRLVWNDEHSRWMVAPEVARGRGKRKSATVEASVAQGVVRAAGRALRGLRWRTPLIGFFAVQQFLMPGFASAQAIRPDGQTQTSVSTIGSVTNVTTGTVRNNNAFNSFQIFNVAPSTTTNLHLPSGTSNLINIVRDERSNIDGQLNAVKDGRIGGNLWFANPNGVIVGPSGVVNAGSVSISTPTRAFADNFFRSPGNPDDSSVNQLLAGTAPRNAAATVSIQGQVNATDSISISAGAIKVGGSLYSGARFTGSAPGFTDVVNANGLAAGSAVVLRDGKIQIVADTDVQISGTLTAPGSTGIKGGTVTIQAGGNVELQSGAQVLAQGGGAASAGGSVQVLAQGDATLASGSLIDASAGQSGDGGFVEFSAKRHVDLAGGVLQARATLGQNGSVLVDPATVTVSQDVYTGGSNYSIVADQTITVSSGVTVSTRNLAAGAAADQDTAASVGASGKLSMSAPSITLLTGTRLLAHATNSFAGGIVSLDATRSGGELSVLSDTNTQISVSGATIKGAAVTLRATSSHVSTLTPIVTKSVHADVLVDSSAITAQAGAITIEAVASADAKTGPLPIPVTVQTINSRARVDIVGASQLTTLGGDVRVGATSTVSTDAKPTSALANLAGDGSVAVSVVTSLASSHIGGSTVVGTSGQLAVTASNTVTASSIADASASGGSAAGASVAVSVVRSTTTALIDGQSVVTAGTGILVKSESGNSMVADAKSAAQGAQEDSGGTSKSKQYLTGYQDSAQTSEGGVKVAGAFGVGDLQSATSATVATTGNVRATTGALEVRSVDNNQSGAKGDGSATGGSIGVGVGLAINLAKVSNLATIADGTDVLARGVTVSAVTKSGATSTFSAEAKSGAGASNVGVAGALAVGVLGTKTAATLQGDKDASGLGAKVAGAGGTVTVEAENRTSSTVSAAADVKPGSDKASSKVGVGASVGVNVSLNTTTAEVEDMARLTGAGAVGINAAAEHAVSTTAQGGSAGASVAVTPVVAVSIALNTTTARLGTSTTALDASGAYSSRASHLNTVTTEAKGETAGEKVSVGASLALTVANDQVKAEVDRDIVAGGAVTIESQSQGRSKTTASASVAGGKEADSNDQPSSGKTVDQQVGDQKTTAGKTGGAKDADAKTKLDGDNSEAPKAESSEGGVSVAAAIAVNIGTNSSSAGIARGRSVTSGAKVRVASAGETDAAASADGSQTDSGGTNVGVGAAIALNVANGTNRATIGDNAQVKGKGVEVSATMVSGETSDFGAEAKSGAGGGKVGVAGALAINIVNTTHAALIEGDKDSSGAGARVDADGLDLQVQSGNKTASTVKATSEVDAAGAAAGVGASVGVNVVANTSSAVVDDGSVVSHAAGMRVLADAAHTASTEVEGGAAGAKVSITPVVAVTVALNTTTARVGTALASTALTGDLQVHASATDEVTNSATGKASGDVAVGASLSAAVVIDHVTASVERDVSSSTAIDVQSSSGVSIKTSAVASAKGAEEKKKSNGDPEDGTTVDEQKSTQLDFAAKRNDSTKTADTSSTETKTPDANTDEKGGAKQGGKKISVAAAIGVSVAENRANASVGAGRSVSTSGKLSIQASTETNYSTSANGEAVSDDNGIAAAVSASVTRNVTHATLGAGATVAQAGSIEISATAQQNRGADFLTAMGARSVSGASGGDVAVAGALAVVLNDNDTRASIEEGATIGTAVSPVGDLSVTAEDTSKIAAQARAGALAKGSNGGESKAGVGASFAVLLSNNATRALVGQDTAAANTASVIHAQSLTLSARKNRVNFNALPNISDVTSFSFDTLDPATYLGSNNYYTEAVAGAASKGQAAVAGAFSVNLFQNVTEASIAPRVSLTTYASQPELVPGTPNAEKLGVDVSARSDILSIAFSGAVAGAKKAGVGISNTDIVNRDETLASIGNGSSVASKGAGSGVKVSADGKQDLTNVSVSAAAATQGVAVAGVLGVVVSLNTVQASIGNTAVVASEGDASVKAKNDTQVVMVAGGVGAGKDVGVGAAIAANIIQNKTYASIGDFAQVQSRKALVVNADADEKAVTAVIAGAGGGKVGVAGALSLNIIRTDTQAWIGEAARVNTDATFQSADQQVAIGATDDTVIVGIAGGGAGGGKVGVGAAIDTSVLAKTVKAFVADDVAADGQVAQVNAVKAISANAASSQSVVSVAAGFAGGGTVGVGGAVSLDIVKNDVQAYIGKAARLDSDGNVLVNAEDEVRAILTAGAAAGGGNVGVGASLAVATLIGNTKAYVNDNAVVNARGNRDAASVYSGATVIVQQSDTPVTPAELAARRKENARGLSVTAYNRETLITTVVGGAGGGTAGVAATVSANVIASTTEATIGRGVKVNETNTAASAQQQVRVKAVDETLLINTAGAAAGGGTAGVGAAGNFAVVAKTTRATIGRGSLVNAKSAVQLGATTSTLTFSTSAGFAGGGSVGVGGAVGGVAVANRTEALIEDGTSSADRATVNVSGGGLNLRGEDFATSWLITGAGAGGGAAGVGVSLSIGVNASTTKARIGNYASTNASGDTDVLAYSTENLNSATVAGAGGGSAGVAGSVGLQVVVSKTEAGIGDFARVNQDAAGQNVRVAATDRIVTVGLAGAGAGGGAAGVGASLVGTVVLNTTSAYIGEGAVVSASNDVTVTATSEKFVNTAVVAGAGGGAAGVAGAIAILSVGSLLDGEASSGLGGGQTQSDADGQTTKSAVGGQLGTASEASEAKTTLDAKADKMAVGKYMASSTPIPLRNTQSFVGFNADVRAGRDVRVKASDSTLAIMAGGAGGGGGAAGVVGSLGVALVRDSAEAFVADGAKVDADRVTEVSATTNENVFNVGLTGSGAGAAAVSGSIVVNVVSSDTAAYMGAAEINKRASISNARSVAVTADSNSNLVTVAASGSGAGAAAVGGVLNANTLIKNTRAYIGRGADVTADTDVEVSAESSQALIGGGISIRGAGAAAVGAVASANVVSNTTEAFIGANRNDSDKTTAASVDSNGNVRLLAADATLIVGMSAVGNGAGAAGVGLNVAANVLSSQTRAYVSENASVNARGNAVGVDIFNGTTSDSSPGAIAALPSGANGNLDIDRDGVADGNVNGGVSFNVKVGGNTTVINPASQGIGTKSGQSAGGGLGSRGRDIGAKGLSVVALGDEKILAATIGIAGAGAAAVTGAAVANVVITRTEAAIKDGAHINTVAGGADRSVRVRAADNTLLVQAVGTVAGAGGAAVSGAVNAGVVLKNTSATIGDADVSARNVEVKALAREDIFDIVVNASVGGAAGVGAAVAVDVVRNETTAKVARGASISATGDLRVVADQDTGIDVYAVSGAGGGVAGVSAAVTVAVINNTTRAYVEDATVVGSAAVLNAGGTTEVAAVARENITSATVSGAAGGIAGVAGAVGVKLVTSTTQAAIGNFARVNQTATGAQQDVQVRAEDTVTLRGGGGTVALGGFAGVGATAEVNIVRTTTTAQIGQNALVKAGRDVAVSATSTKDVESAAVAAAGGLSAGIAGAVSVVSIGASLDADSQASLRDTDSNSNTASFADSKVKQDKVTGSLGNSEHVQGTKTEVSGRVTSLGVASDMNESATASLDKTRAFVGGNSQIVAGGDVSVTATDRLRLRMNVAGAAGGFVGIGGAFGVATTKATTEAFVGDNTTVDAGDDVLVKAQAVNVDSGGAEVRSAAGAGGVVGVSAAVAAIDDRSITRASLSSNAKVLHADAVTVQAQTSHNARAETLGASVGAIAIGASVARSEFNGETVAWLGAGVEIGLAPSLTVNSVAVLASDESVAYASATAGTAGILAGSGADAKATAGAKVQAFTSDGAKVLAQESVDVEATSTPRTEAAALGINIGAGAVGASLANARSNALVEASLGRNNIVTAAALDIQARRVLAAGPTTLASATGASGGLLFGINATEAVANSSGLTNAQIGDGSTVTVTGVATVQADSQSKQTASGLGFSAGFIAAGADYARANSSTTTQALLGANVKLSAGTLQVLAGGTDSNYAWAQAGSGGVVSAPFSEASTANTSVTYARTGSGNNDVSNARKIDVGTLLVSASHTANFNSWIDSTNASLIGVSGATATNGVNTRSEAWVGPTGWVEADNITVQASNLVRKAVPAGPKIPGLNQNIPAWNVNSSSGGLADIPAAGSTSRITTNAVASIGNGTHLEQTGSVGSPGVFNIDAWNDVQAQDRVKMASGGAISAASGKSVVLADVNNATVQVQDSTHLFSVGDIAMGARSIANVSTQTAVDVYGAVGVAPAGDSVSRFQGVNSVNIGAAAIQSMRDIRISAGANTADQGNDLTAVARTDVYNNTAIPVNRDPVADAVLVTRSNIAIAAGADIGSVRDIKLYAEKGTANASGVGIGKDIYREALAAVASAVSNAFGGGDVSFETRTGRSIRDQASDVAVNGDVRVGIHRKQELVIGPDGLATKQTDGISITKTGFKSIAKDILDRIDDLNELIRQYTVDSPTADATIAVAAYRSEIRFLQKKLKDINYVADPLGGFNGVASISEKQAAQDAINGMNATKTSLATRKTQLQTDNTGLTANNTTLTNQNTTLTSNNTTLTNQNTTLQGQLNALPANDSGRAALQNQINTNNTTIATNNQTKTNNNATIATNNTSIATNNTEITSIDSRVTGLNTQIASIDVNSLSDLAAGGPVAKYLTISDALAQLGNIYVHGDKLRGGGTLDAPGDAEIKITNNGPSFLVLKNLSIPPDAGGKVYFNSVDVGSSADINRVNGPTAGAAFQVFTASSAFDSSGNAVTVTKPRILVESKYDPLDPLYIAQTPANTPKLAPDIILQGDVSNLRGLVKIDSAAGSIRLEQKRDANDDVIQPVSTANIRAQDVEVKTRNGDFVQSYSNTFFHTAGAPLTITPGNPNLAFPGNIDTIIHTPETAGAGIIANGSVLIAARYLNINGNIQSGISEWGVRVPSGANVAFNGGNGSFVQAKAFYDLQSPAQKSVLGAEYFAVSGATVSGLSGNQQGAWEPVTVRYNAKENRLELSGVQVQGGYIELFGQIFNTNQAGGGKLRVLDGYGQVKVANETSLPLWLNLLDTGRGAQGEINITNISGLDANDNPVITTTSYTRSNGAARTGNSASYRYDPQAGLRYALTVGYDTGKDEYYRYSQSGWFDISATFSSLAQDRYRLNSVVRSNDPLSRGEVLGPISGASGVYFPRQQTNTTSSVLSPGRSWKDCNWWTLCANATYYQEFSIATKTKTVKLDSVKADYAIGIEYIGFDNGSVSVVSTGDLFVNGAINNRNGNTSLSSAGQIRQNGDLALIGGNAVSLSAGTGLGASTQSLRVNVKDGGRLDATSASGEVRVSQALGDLRFGTIGGAGVSNVVLDTDRNLLPFDASSRIQGLRVDLTARNGGIGEVSGSPATPVVVRTGYTTAMSDWPNYGLKLSARDSINVTNESDSANAAVYSGNLLLIAAESRTGDVKVQTTGSVIDNNPFATTDTRTQTELANLWDSLRLRGALAVEKADQSVAAFRRGKENNYQLYWLMRKTQADQGAVYNPNFQYQVSSAERAVLTQSGLDAGQIANFAANRTAQYHALNAEVGSFTSSFAPGFHYTVSAAEDAQIRKGSSWSDAQLQLSVGAGLLKNITDTVTTIKEPNAKGRSVTLIAGSNLGSYNTELRIDLTAGLNALTVEQKAALAAAERGDATLNGDIITIVQPRPVNVAVGSGALNATASSGYALLGSEEDLRIDRVEASRDIRIKTARSLINAASVAGAANVVGANIILEAANGGIGSVPDANGAVSTPLRVSAASGSGVIARAASDIWIDSPQDIALDTVFSRGNLRVDAQGSILDFHTGESSVTPDLNLRSRNLTLTATGGSIGSFANPLDVSVNPDGFITATTTTTGRGVYLNGPAGENFNIGAVTSGDAVSLSSALDMKIDGPVTGPGPFSLVAGGLMTFTPRADVHATALGVFLRAANLTMEDAGDAVHAAQLRVDSGTVDIETAGDALITGISVGNPTSSAIRLVSTAGRILDNGDTRLDIIADTPPSATLTISAAKGIGDNPLDVRLLNLQADSGGVVDLAVQGPVNIVAIAAADRVLLTATGTISGDSVRSTGTGSNLDKSISITSATGLVNLATIDGSAAVRVNAPTANIVVGSVTGDAVALNAPVSVVANRVNAGSSVQIGSDLIQASVTGGSSPVGGSIGGFGGGPASFVNATFNSLGGFLLDSLSAASAVVNVPAGSFNVDQLLIVDRATITNPLTSLVVDQHNRAIQPFDVQLYSDGAPFSLDMSANRVDTNAFVIYRSPLHEVLTPTSANFSAVEQGEHNLNGVKPEPQPALPAGKGGSGLVTVSGGGVSISGNCLENDKDPECTK